MYAQKAFIEIGKAIERIKAEKDFSFLLSAGESANTLIKSLVSIFSLSDAIKDELLDELYDVFNAQIDKINNPSPF